MRRFLAGLALLVVLVPSVGSAEEGPAAVRFRLRGEIDAIKARFQAGTVQERRQALAGFVRSLRAARGNVPAQVMEDYRTLSAEAFKLKHGKDRPTPALSNIHFTEGYPRAVTRHQIEERLQQMVTQAYGVGFKQLGVDVDFSHGHILYGPDPSRKLPPRRSGAFLQRQPYIEENHGNQPVAILYHTQEFAFDAEKAGDKANGYVNRERRNWLQDWKTGKVYDARDFLKTGQSMNDHYTVFEAQLDTARLGLGTRPVNTSRGVEQYPIGSFQFDFNRVDGPAASSSGRLDPGIISSVLPDGQRVFLKLTSNLTHDLVNPYKK